jgi:hypothetical protein
VYCVELRVAVKCDGCDHSIPVNGPRPRVKCPECQEILELKGRLRWAEVLNYQNPTVDVFTATRGHEPGQGDYGAWAPVKLNSRRVWPSCPECDHAFAPDETMAALDGGGALSCPACSASLSIDPAPAILTGPFPATRWLVGADALQEGDGPRVSTAFGGKPVAMACMSCGGGLRVDGSSRLVTCAYCEVPNYLPDDLWLALHPAPKRERWYVLFE